MKYEKKKEKKEMKYEKKKKKKKMKYKKKKMKKKNCQAPREDRTPDPWFTRPVLYH